MIPVPRQPEMGRPTATGVLALVWGRKQGEPRSSAVLGRCFAQLVSAARRGKRQAAGNFNGSTLINAQANQFPSRIVDRPVAAMAVLTDRKPGHGDEIGLPN